MKKFFANNVPSFIFGGLFSLLLAIIIGFLVFLIIEHTLLFDNETTPYSFEISLIFSILFFFFCWIVHFLTDKKTNALIAESEKRIEDMLEKRKLMEEEFPSVSYISEDNKA